LEGAIYCWKRRIPTLPLEQIRLRGSRIPLNSQRQLQVPDPLLPAISPATHLAAEPERCPHLPWLRKNLFCTSQMPQAIHMCNMPHTRSLQQFSAPHPSPQARTASSARLCIVAAPQFPGIFSARHALLQGHIQSCSLFFSTPCANAFLLCLTTPCSILVARRARIFPATRPAAEAADKPFSFSLHVLISFLATHGRLCTHHPPARLG
jgi:hypothetical protein